MILRYLVILLSVVCVSVNAKAVLEIKPNIGTNYKKTGENLVLHCKVIEDPSDDQPFQVTEPPKWSFMSTDSDKWTGFTTTGRNRIKYVDPNTTHLLITNAELGDAGSYKCSAKVSTEDLPLEKEIPVVVYGKIKFENVLRDQHPIENEKAEIKCYASGKPRPEINWYKVGTGSDQQDIDTPLDSTIKGYQLEDNGQILVIENFDKSQHDGSYKCEINQIESGDRDEMSINVVGYVRPTIKELKKDDRYLEGSSGNLVCSANGIPLPKITWSKDGQQLTPGDVYKVDPEGLLKILSIAPQDAGTYTCEIENVVGKASESTPILVYLKPTIVADHNRTVERGKSMEIACNFGGSPNLTAEWRFQNNPIPVSIGQSTDESLTDEKKLNKFVVNETNKIILKIDNTSQVDAGEYECRVTNDAGTATHISNVQIEHAPIVALIGPTVIRVLEEQPVEISCKADALPIPGWLWYRDGSQVDKTLFINTDSQTKSTLSFATARDNYGVYECEASNSHGASKRNVSVIKTEVPPGPVLETPHDSKPNKAVLHVSNYAEMTKSQEPDTVMVKYIEIFPEQLEPEPDWYMNNPDAISQNFTYSPTGMFTLTKLLPNKKYLIAISGQNMAGQSQWGTLTYQTSDPVLPSQPSFRTANFSSCLHGSHCLVAWEASDDNGSPMRAYQLQYKLVDDPLGFWTTTQAPASEFVAQTKQDAESQLTDRLAQPLKPDTWSNVLLQVDDTNRENSEYEVELKNLIPKSTYVVKVYAENAIGSSLPTPELYVRTRDFPHTDLLAGGVNAGAIVAIVVLVVLIFVLIVDVACYYVNQCGLLMCLCVNCCGKTPPDVKAKEIDLEQAGMPEDKKPLHDAEDLKVDREDTPMITEKSSSLKKDTSV